MFTEKFSIDGKQWYLLEWIGVDFWKMEQLLEPPKFNTIEEIINNIKEIYPESNIKATFIGEWKKKKK